MTIRVEGLAGPEMPWGDSGGASAAVWAKSWEASGTRPGAAADAALGGNAGGIARSAGAPAEAGVALVALDSVGESPLGAAARGAAKASVE